MPRNRLLAIVSTGALLALLAADARAGAIVRFRPEATPAKALVRLGDIADIHADDPAEQARLAGLAIAPAPPPGRTARFDFAAVRSRLESFGIDLASTEFTGASATLVKTPDAEPAPPAPAKPVRPEPATPAPRPVPSLTDNQARRLEDVFARAALQYLARQTPAVREVEVEVAFTPEELDGLAAAAGSLLAGTTLLSVSGGEAPYVGRQALDFSFRNPGGGDTVCRPLCRVQPWPRVLQVKGTVHKGSILRAEDLVEKPVPPNQRDEDAQPATLGDVVGRETTRVLRGGEMLRRDDLREVALVRRGELVTVYSRRPGITVKVEARSLDEGAVGQSVTVVTLDGKSKFVARVVAYHEVEVGGSPAPGPR